MAQRRRLSSQLLDRSWKGLFLSLFLVSCAHNSSLVAVDGDDWDQFLILLKSENSKLREQLKVAHLQIEHFKKQSEKYRSFEDQVFINIRKSYKDKQWDLLRSQVDQIMGEYPLDDDRLIQSAFFLAELSRQLGHLSHALQSYDWLLRNPSNRTYRAATHLGMGLVYGQMGLHKEAQEMFSTLLEKYPESSEAVLASREISDLRHLQSFKGKNL